MTILEQDDAELREVFDIVHKSATEKSNYIEVLSPQFQSPNWDHSRITYGMKDCFVGNPIHRTLHGGFIATMLDTAGGHAVFLSVFNKAKGLSAEKKFRLLSKIGSIDLRIDFLRPGKGRRFIADARILRIGRKIAVVRMELRNDEDHLIAVGTGTYTVG